MVCIELNLGDQGKELVRKITESMQKVLDPGHGCFLGLLELKWERFYVALENDSLELQRTS